MHSFTQRLSPTRLWESETQNLAKRDHRTKFISTESLNYKNTNSPPLNKKSAPLSLEIVAHDVFLQLKCACGEIGIRARLRIWCRETCRFESYQAHCFSTTPLLTMIKRGVLFLSPLQPEIAHETAFAYPPTTQIHGSSKEEVQAERKFALKSSQKQAHFFEKRPHFSNKPVDFFFRLPLFFSLSRTCTRTSAISENHLHPSPHSTAH